MQRSSDFGPWISIIIDLLILILILIVAFLVFGKVFNVASDDAGAPSGSSNDSQISVEQTLVLISKDPDTLGTTRDFSELETYLGADVVYVSASEPAYLITADKRRFYVGDVLEPDVEFKKISSTQLVLKQARETIVFSLSDESPI